MFGAYGILPYLCTRIQNNAAECHSFKGEMLEIPGKYQSGQMGQTVNLLAYAFGGSNPSLPTTPSRRKSRK